MTRILSIGSLYPPQHLGGYELVWQAAVRALRRSGHDVRVLTTGTVFDAAADRDEEDPAVHRELRWYWRDHAFPRLRASEREELERHNHAVLDRHLAAHDPEVVSWWAMGGMSLSLVERVRRLEIPALGWVNDDWLIYAPEVDQYQRGLARRPWRRAIAERRTRAPATVDLRTAARWVFCSEAVRRAALAIRPGLADTAVLHQGVAPDFHPRPAPSSWSGRLLYVGRIDARKGLRTLLAAVDRLDDAYLRIVGDGDPDEMARLQATAGPRVTFDGPRSRAELPAVYADCDAVVFPVEWAEPYGLVPLEAMAVGRPVVATGHGGSGEYLEDGRNALLFESGSSGALAAAIRRLAGDPSLRSRLREGGLQTAVRLTEARWTAAVVAEHEAARDRIAPCSGSAPPSGARVHGA